MEGMSMFAQSLARLYKAKEVTDAKIEELLQAGKLNEAEAAAIKEAKA